MHFYYDIACLHWEFIFLYKKLYYWSLSTCKDRLFSPQICFFFWENLDDLMKVGLKYFSRQKQVSRVYDATHFEMEVFEKGLPYQKGKSLCVMHHSNDLHERPPNGPWISKQTTLAGKVNMRRRENTAQLNSVIKRVHHVVPVHPGHFLLMPTTITPLAQKTPINFPCVSVEQDRGVA